jgi:phosphoglycolate phosphatase
LQKEGGGRFTTRKSRARENGNVTRLLLFDVDLTLIHSGGAGRLAMDRALERMFGVEKPTEGIMFDGRTDRGIFLEALGRYDKSPEERLDEFSEAYLRELPVALKERSGRVMPGVHELLAALQEEPVAIGLATGNMRRGAEAKLRRYGLWERFRGGGFGDSTTVRSDVIVSAIESIAAAHEAPAKATNALVIGDTPLDVEAAKAAGARSLGVGTGRFTPEELLAAGADMAVEDLGDTAGVVEMLVY